MKKNKNPLSIHTYGSAEPGGVPYSCTNLTSALLEWWQVNYQVTGLVPRHAISLTHTHTHAHNKHTPSLVQPNHTAQRQRINYRCALNYFHYLACLVNRTETGLMDGKGFAEPAQVLLWLTLLQTFTFLSIPRDLSAFPFNANILPSQFRCESSNWSYVDELKWIFHWNVGEHEWEWGFNSW